eukprot:1841845-Rhodomonas_salina.1
MMMMMVMVMVMVMVMMMMMVMMVMVMMMMIMEMVMMVPFGFCINARRCCISPMQSVHPSRSCPNPPCFVLLETTTRMCGCG